MLIWLLIIIVLIWVSYDNRNGARNGARNDNQESEQEQLYRRLIEEESRIRQNQIQHSEMLRQREELRKKQPDNSSSNHD